MKRHMEEVAAGQRFEFGKNWESFLSVLNDERIKEAEKSLTEMLEHKSLIDKQFLDIGSGSGLFSLVAKRLGAKVHSFDYDPESVACTAELKRRYYPDNSEWTVEEGSILDEDFLNSLGSFDIVYSWGVLHHTGDMWKALENTKNLVSDNGLLFIAIYNDQGVISRIWRRIKKAYCSGPLAKRLISILMIPFFVVQNIAISTIKRRNPIKAWLNKGKRGMSPYHDAKDWLGGYPFEVAKPEEIFDYYNNFGFTLMKMITTNRNGCNQFVFQKIKPL